jgi:hypothetical protein
MIRRQLHRPSAHRVPRVVVLLLVMPLPLKAYADPGSGIMLWQLGGAFLFGCLYHIRKFFIRLRKRK